MVDRMNVATTIERLADERVHELLAEHRCSCTPSARAASEPPKVAYTVREVAK